MSEKLRQDFETFSPMQFIKAIAKVSRPDEKIPNGHDIGRECYAFSPQEDAAFAVAEEMAKKILDGLVEEVDYTIETDAIGNLFIRYFGTDPNAKVIMIGSHLDSVANGGMYDGVAGVATALDSLAKTVSLLEKPKQDLVVAVWRSEESSPRNGIACLGSSIATGALTEEQLNGIFYNREKGILLRDHITEWGKKNKRPSDPDLWKKVLALAKNPYLNKDRIGAYFEAHIEQSAVIDVNDKEIGIVTGGIGGARRDTLDSKFKPDSIKVTEGQYKKVSLAFLGEPTHTGGTPPNPRFFKDRKGMARYRKDALVAASYAANRLLRVPGVKLLRTGPHHPTGFTSVPAHQEVELLVPVSSARMFTNKLLGLKSHVRAKLQVEMERTASTDVPAGTVEFVPRGRARALLDFPQIVSVLSTEAFEREGTATGTTRATTVDFYLRPEGVAFNLDLREVNEQDLMRLIRSIYEHVFISLHSGEFKTLSVKTHAPVDQALVARLEEYASKLGISFVLMPSMPGHDADRMAALGIPTAMVFIRHDGLSHNPKEAMHERDFAKASAVLREAIREMQGH